MNVLFLISLIAAVLLSILAIADVALLILDRDQTK